MKNEQDLWQFYAILIMNKKDDENEFNLLMY